MSDTIAFIVFFLFRMVKSILNFIKLHERNSSESNWAILKN